ncbi:MAG: fumarylacetoacetate hydrolase family protein, partial [Bradyrhizobium sp.]|nr:fumarylacetoacetate hydrolase family protein [Bradyrhizobium sp.]
MTHPNDPSLRSFIPVDPASDFPIQNLPYGVFSAADSPKPRVGVAIGDVVLDLAVLEDEGLLDLSPAYEVFAQPSLNAFMALGPAVWTKTRAAISALLRHDNPRLRDDKPLRSRALLLQKDVRLHLPFDVAGYTDFYSSKEHATNVGVMFRGKDNALQPNWLHMPIGYNGRASTVVVSGTPVRRPRGQLKPPSAEVPSFGPCKRLDFELEMGVVIGQSSALG